VVLEKNKDFIVAEIAFVCEHALLGNVYSILIAINYVRNKSYKNCRRKLRSWFPGNLIPPTSTINRLKKNFLQQVICYKGGERIATCTVRRKTLYITLM
jgi:hypothetical protein